MIYLRPIGGLCNRMRAIDGMLSYAEAHKRLVTVIWINNNKLNCSFHDLFESVDSAYLNFIELNPYKSFRDRMKVKMLDLAERTLSPYLRKLFIGIGTGIYDFNATKINPEWAGIYNSVELFETNTMRETELAFHKKTRSVINDLLSHKKVYIASCYRLFNSKDHYKRFIPVNVLKDQIADIKSNFKSTSGLHIRAVNHPYASKYSTVDKFEKLIDQRLEKNPESSFFLATDSANVKSRLLERYGPNIILSNPTDTYSRSDSNAIMQALVDLYCLASTDNIFGSMYSSFTLTAADIGKVKTTIVK